MNMNGQTVTLDLNKINKVLDSAVFELHDRLQRELGKINEEIRSAHIAESRGESQQHYLGLCHANTGRDSLVRVAQNLSEAIHAKFHVAEAIKRESVVVIKTPA
jgi:hypothetical protein